MAWLDGYFAGEDASPTTIPLAPEGTDFQRHVWEAMDTIPYGATRTDEHRAQARTLAQASVVDGTELRREADSIAEQIADTQDDAAAYAREALPVDEALVEQAIEADRAND